MKKDLKRMKKVLRNPCNLSLCAYRQRDNQTKPNQKNENYKIIGKPGSRAKTNEKPFALPHRLCGVEPRNRRIYMFCGI